MYSSPCFGVWRLWLPIIQLPCSYCWRDMRVFTKTNEAGISGHWAAYPFTASRSEGTPLSQLLPGSTVTDLVILSPSSLLPPVCPRRKTAEDSMAGRTGRMKKAGFLCILIYVCVWAGSLLLSVCVSYSHIVAWHFTPSTLRLFSCCLYLLPACSHYLTVKHSSTQPLPTVPH